MWGERNFFLFGTVSEIHISWNFPSFREVLAFDFFFSISRKFPSLEIGKSRGFCRLETSSHLEYFQLYRLPNCSEISDCRDFQNISEIFDSQNCRIISSISLDTIQTEVRNWFWTSRNENWNGIVSPDSSRDFAYPITLLWMNTGSRSAFGYIDQTFFSTFPSVLRGECRCDNLINILAAIFLFLVPGRALAKGRSLSNMWHANHCTLSSI